MNNFICKVSLLIDMKIAINIRVIQPLQMYEAADIDGASIWQKIRYIDLPTLVVVSSLQVNCFT